MTIDHHESKTACCPRLTMSRLQRHLKANRGLRSGFAGLNIDALVSALIQVKWTGI
jgi:hypothetical protein